MPTDPLWIAIYIVLALGVIALSLAAFAVYRAQDTRDLLDHLTESLSRGARSSGPGSGSSSGPGSGPGSRLGSGPGRPVPTTAQPTEVIASSRVAARPMLASEDPQRLVAPPPQVRTADGAIATGDWLQHYARPQVLISWPITWPGVVGEFYRRLGLDDEVASYFYLVDVAKIKQHFALVMVKITRQGITVGDRETLRVAHQNVRNRRGEPITDRILDKVFDVMVAVLSESGVPREAIEDLGRMLAEAGLRSVLVVESVRI